jgi:hypothetical protein
MLARMDSWAYMGDLMWLYLVIFSEVILRALGLKKNSLLRGNFNKFKLSY